MIEFKEALEQVLQCDEPMEEVETDGYSQYSGSSLMGPGCDQITEKLDPYIYL